MLVPTKSYVKLAKVNMGLTQVIEIILIFFPNFPIIYPVEPIYYCPGHPSNIISQGALKFYVGFQEVTSKHLERCDFVGTQGHY